MRFKYSNVPQELFCIDSFSAKEAPMGLLDARPAIKKVIYNSPATIVLWDDGSRTIVKCDKDDKYDPKYGFALCCMKKFFGSSRAFNDALRAGRAAELESGPTHDFIEEMLRTNDFSLIPHGYCPFGCACSVCIYRDAKKCTEMAYKTVLDYLSLKEKKKHGPDGQSD